MSASRDCISLGRSMIIRVLRPADLAGQGPFRFEVCVAGCSWVYEDLMPEDFDALAAFLRMFAGTRP